MTEHENNQAWLHNLSSDLWYQLNKLVKHDGGGYLQAKLRSTCPVAEERADRIKRLEGIKRQMDGGDDLSLLNPGAIIWVSALVELFLTVEMQMVNPELTTGIRQRLVKMAGKRLNAMYDWMEGETGGEYERVFF